MRLTKSFIALILSNFITDSYGQNCPSIGAIRWDAWHGSAESIVARAVETALTPEQFHYRLPFCSVVSDSNVKIDCSTSETIDREIEYASIGGISYWAFLTYPSGNPMGKSFENFLKSKKRHLLRFSLILTPNSITQSSSTNEKNLGRFAEYANYPNYQLVLKDRPLFYFLLEGDAMQKPDAEKWLIGTVDKLRSLVKEKGLKNPYLVLMDANPTRAAELAKNFGFDAISAYAVHGNAKGGSYQLLVSEVKNFWERAKKTGVKVIPIAMTGWDRRPRVLNPVPWETNQSLQSKSIEYFYNQPSSNELAVHVVEAVKWVQTNEKIAEANTVIIYAWNENDEGGWLIPTLKNGSARLLQIKKQIPSVCKK